MLHRKIYYKGLFRTIVEEIRLKKENIESRLDNIEEILKMLLVDSVIGHSEIDRLQSDILYNFRDNLLKLGMNNLRLNFIEDRYYLFAEVDNREGLKNIKRNYNRASSLTDEIKIVLVFEKIDVRRKTLLEESKISFYVKGGEMKIF